MVSTQVSGAWAAGVFSSLLSVATRSGIGSPARLVRTLDAVSAQRLRDSAAHYVANSRRFAKGLVAIGCAANANPQPGFDPGGPDLSDGLSDFADQSYQNVSRETFLSDRGLKSYKVQYSGLAFDLVRSIDFSVQFEEGGGGASMGQPVAGTHPRCKFCSDQGCHAGCQAAAAWPRPSPAFGTSQAVNDGMFCTGIPHQESA